MICFCFIQCVCYDLVHQSEENLNTIVECNEGSIQSYVHMLLFHLTCSVYRVEVLKLTRVVLYKITTMSHAWTCPSLFVHCHGNAKFGIRDCPHVSAVEFSPCTSTPRIGNCSLYWAWTMNTHRKKFSSLHAEILDIDGKNSSPSPRRNQITLKLQLEGSLIRSDPSSRCSISQSYR